MLQCNELKIDIDTGSTTTTRKWQIKITQYECGNLMAPEQDCLQYHTASTGDQHGIISIVSYEILRSRYDCQLQLGHQRQLCFLLPGPSVQSVLRHLYQTSPELLLRLLQSRHNLHHGGLLLRLECRRIRASYGSCVREFVHGENYPVNHRHK